MNITEYLSLIPIWLWITLALASMLISWFYVEITLAPSGEEILNRGFVTHNTLYEEQKKEIKDLNEEIRLLGVANQNKYNEGISDGYELGWKDCEKFIKEHKTPEGKIELTPEVKEALTGMAAEIDKINGVFVNASKKVF